jgi:hypothetical protein
MSTADNTSEASISDVSEANADIPVPASTYIHGAVSTPNTDCLSTAPTFPYASSHLHELSMPSGLATKVSKRHGVLRHARTSARHNAYSLPSLGQRQAFKRRFRHKKDMFIEGSHLPSVPPVEPTAVSPATDLVLASMHIEVSPTPLNPIEIHLSSQFSNHCNVTESPSIPTDSVLAPTLTPHDALSTSQMSGLTIKIPGLVDRLALRLLGSCSVTEQLEEEDDDSSLDGYSPSESSSESDVEDDYNPTFHSPSSNPDRPSRRRLRRGAAAPYHRAGGKLKRKELWADADAPARSEVPDFLLGGPPTAGRPRSRALRSGRLY